MATLKTKPGRDIWLYGGGALFRSLLDAGLVDTVEVAVVPVLLGAGVPLLPPGADEANPGGPEDAPCQRDPRRSCTRDLGASVEFPGFATFAPKVYSLKSQDR